MRFASLADRAQPAVGGFRGKVLGRRSPEQARIGAANGRDARAPAERESSSSRFLPLPFIEVIEAPTICSIRLRSLNGAAAPVAQRQNAPPATPEAARGGLRELQGTRRPRRKVDLVPCAARSMASVGSPFARLRDERAAVAVGCGDKARRA